ncbi:MAG: response regulator [Ginsengibacter sp.]
MKRILVIDNDPDILYTVDLILKQMTIHVMTAENANDVQTSISTFKPDLILLDILLGGVDGRLICQDIKLKEQSPLVILFSANAHLLQTYQDYEADGFIAKPFDIKDFSNKISNYLFKLPAKNFAQSHNEYGY